VKVDTTVLFVIYLEARSIGEGGANKKENRKTKGLCSLPVILSIHCVILWLAVQNLFGHGVTMPQGSVKMFGHSVTG